MSMRLRLTMVGILPMSEVDIEERKRRIKNFISEIISKNPSMSDWNIVRACQDEYSGPLFSEINFYSLVCDAKKDREELWKQHFKHHDRVNGQ